MSYYVQSFKCTVSNMLHLGLVIDLASQGFHIGDIFDLSVVHDIENEKNVAYII